MLPWDPLWRLRHVGYPVSPRGYRGLPAFASLSMAGSVGAHCRQLERQGCANAQLENGQLERHCRLDRECRAFLLRAMNSLGVSARGYHRILRVARSIADLAGEEAIALPHVTEAVGYRRLDAGASVY